MRAILRKAVRPAAWLVAALGVVIAASEYREVHREAALHAAADTYGRVDGWIGAARCARRTGALLTACTADGRRVPIEDHSVADDIGHSLVLGLVARHTDLALDRVTLVRVNLVLNLAGLAVLTTLLAAGGFPIAAAILLPWGGSIVFSEHMSADVQGAYYGVVAFALAMPLWLAIGARRTLPAARYWTLLVACGPLLALAALIREPIGIVGLATTLAALGLHLFLRRREQESGRRIATVAIVLVAVLISQRAAPWLVDYRAHAYGVGPGQLQSSHGIGHNLFMGLGTERNPWGIQWDDVYAARAVQAADPDIVYASRAYHRKLMAMWWESVQSHPLAALRIYLAKLVAALNLRPPGHPKFGLFIPITLVALFWGLRRGRGREPNPELTAQWPLHATVALFTAGFLMQGVLTVPSPAYLFPSGVGGIVIWALLLECFARRGAGWPGPGAGVP